MIFIKSKEEIKLMREAGRRLAKVFEKIEQFVSVDVSTFELNQRIEELLEASDLIARCKGYKGYPASSCISVNDVVVHGIPSKTDILKNGDFVKIDVVADFRGFCADMARGFYVGTPSDLAVRMNDVAAKAFEAGAEKAKHGNYVEDISRAVQDIIEKEGFHVVKEFAGHGIGRHIHESPEVPNYIYPRHQIKLFSGMTIAIEPMITEKKCNVVIDKDGWTARSNDKSLAAHFENTVLITDSGCEILTKT